MLIESKKRAFRRTGIAAEVVLFKRPETCGTRSRLSWTGFEGQQEPTAGWAAGRLATMYWLLRSLSAVPLSGRRFCDRAISLLLRERVITTSWPGARGSGDLDCELTNGYLNMKVACWPPSDCNESDRMQYQFICSILQRCISPYLVISCAFRQSAPFSISPILAIASVHLESGRGLQQTAVHLAARLTQYSTCNLRSLAVNSSIEGGGCSLVTRLAPLALEFWNQ